MSEMEDMSVDEYLHWMAFFKLEKRHMDAIRNKAKSKSGRKR